MELVQISDLEGAPYEYEFSDQDWEDVALYKFRLQLEALEDWERDLDLSNETDVAQMREWFAKHDEEFEQKAQAQRIAEWEKDRRLERLAHGY